jgi:hypothetical protein
MTQTPFHSPPPSSRSNAGSRMTMEERTIEERAARERAERARAERAELSARDIAAEDAVDEPRAPEPSLGTSYLGEGMTEESWERWRQIQANFVDDPRRSVADAHGLVGEVIDGIVHRFENERQQLEQRWSSGEDVSTEDLRHCLQRYRDFFGRLLANLGEVKV